MSNNSSVSTLSSLAQGVLADYSVYLTENYITVSAAVILFYDYLQTISLEVAAIWNDRLNLSKFLFILNRYSFLTYTFATVFIDFYKPATNTVSTIFYTFAVLGIFTLRTFAIYGRSRAVLFILSIIALVNLTGVVLSDRLLKHYLGNYKTDLILASYIQGIHWIPANLLTPVGTAAFDLLVLVLTVYKTAALVKRSREAELTKTLAYVLLRDGAIYYAIVFIPTILTVVFERISAVSYDIYFQYAYYNLSIISTTLQIVMTNRLVLNLRLTANTREDFEFRTRTGLETAVFAHGSIIGNIGAPVRTLPEGWDEDVADWELEDSTRRNEGKSPANYDLEVQSGDIAVPTIAEEDSDQIEENQA